MRNLLSKDKVGEMFLFLLGVGAGIMIGVSWVKGKSKDSGLLFLVIL